MNKRNLMLFQFIFALVLFRCSNIRHNFTDFSKDKVHVLCKFYYTTCLNKTHAYRFHIVCVQRTVLKGSLFNKNWHTINTLFQRDIQTLLHILQYTFDSKTSCMIQKRTNIDTIEYLTFCIANNTCYFIPILQ